MKKKNLIRRDDYDRVLITETLPYETPIIFSNDGLYDRIKGIEKEPSFQRALLSAIVFNANPNLAEKCTRPYLYKVKKNSLEYRRLALLHPSSQWRIRNFYEKYHSLILYYCSSSPASIRSPKSIASSFYSKGAWENVYKYKNGTVATELIDGYAKNTPSFFAYRGHDRLYKFFMSPAYLQIEKRFPVQMTLDVSKCFDSIYTHSMAWATKDKEFIKKNVHLNLKSFADEFDVAIRHGNHNETNGIPIGPEISRIFAEIIFQKIDRIAIRKLREQNLEFDNDYTFRRYVDDVYIFSSSQDLVEKIYSIYSDSLTLYNLHANSAKSQINFRPFISKKSRLISGASEKLNQFIDSFLISEKQGELSPKQIRSAWSISNKFIDNIKVLCSQNDVGYDEISSFIIAALTERVKLLVAGNVDEADASKQKDYYEAISAIIETQFFFYSVAPSVSASYKISTSIILLIRFSRSQLAAYEHEIANKIYELSHSLLRTECQRSQTAVVDGFIHMEYLNILLAARELGDDHLLPEQLINDLFIKDKELTYFTINSCLFYIRDNKEYSAIRASIISAVRGALKDIKKIFSSSEKAHLLLDAVGCPYIPIKVRISWIKTLAKLLGLPPLNTASANAVAVQVASEHWQVNWADVDLLNSLEKKELKQAY